MIELFKMSGVVRSERLVVYVTKDCASEMVRGTLYHHELQRVQVPDMSKVEKSSGDDERQAVASSTLSSGWDIRTP